MSIITFWSNTKKQTSQTMSLAAIATSMAIEHNYKILIISTIYNDDTLELCFGDLNNNKKLLKKLVKDANIAVDNGIEGLSKMAHSGRMTPDIIQNYTNVIYKNRLEILYGYKEEKDRPSEEQYLRIREKYKEIIKNAGNFYDMVFVDVEKGLDDEYVKQILKISDLVIINTEQKIGMINEINELIHSELRNDNFIINIGRFDSYSKYSIKNISRYLKMKRDISVIPYNTLYFEAASEESVADLFLKIRNVSEGDRNKAFVTETKNAAEKIVYKLQELQMKM